MAKVIKRSIYGKGKTSAWTQLQDDIVKLTSSVRPFVSVGFVIHMQTIFFGNSNYVGIINVAIKCGVPVRI